MSPRTSSTTFGWRLPTWPDDENLAESMWPAIIKHLQTLAGSYDPIWLSDHVVPPQAWLGPSLPALDAWTSLVHYAAAFPAFRFGNMVMNNSFRHPALLAKAAATSQFLTGGRIVLGLGAGLSENENRAYGYEFPSNAVRIRQLDESLHIIRRMWTDSPATFSGTYYRIENAYCEPRPNPPPPILIGGGGEQLTLRVVARHADWWNPQARDLATYEHKIGVLGRHCEEIGRDPRAIRMTHTCSCVAVASTEADARRLAQQSTFYKHIPPDAAFVGTPEMVADQIRPYLALGVEHVVIARFADFPQLDGAHQFAAEVVPLLR
jgi:alkanesulfonate monooxygenase SsuD/methylene tetrahydromethanopterin reductase-like flavin-dependent oxidoreductase (luciferase family)